MMGIMKIKCLNRFLDLSISSLELPTAISIFASQTLSPVAYHAVVVKNSKFGYNTLIG